MLQSLRQTLLRAPYAAPQDLSEKTAVVTGTSSGSIGCTTAKTLAQWGATVVVTAREKPVATAALISAESGGNVIPLSLDLTRRESVAAFVAACNDSLDGQLDVLVNNAGIHLDLLSRWKAPRLSDDGYELHWRTNYLGSFDLTQGLLPMLRSAAERRDESRIVNVVSQLHTRGRNKALFEPVTPYNSWVAYGTSKLAVVHMTREMQRRYSDQGIISSCLHPGAVFSNIADKGLADAPLLSRIRRVLAPLERSFMLTTEQGAQTSLHCATSPSVEGGQYFRKCRPAAASPQADDAAASARLWDQTLAWMNSDPLR